MKWRWHILTFFLSFLISWFVFATIWYMIALSHGDLTLDEDKQIYFNASMISHLNELNYMYANDLHFKNFEMMNTSALLVEYIISNLNVSSMNQSVLSELIKIKSKIVGKKAEHIPCVYGIRDFTTALLYSVETQHTSGILFLRSNT